MRPDGIRIMCLPEPLFSKHGKSDSFMDIWIMHLFEISVNGYCNIEDKRKMEYLRIRELLVSKLLADASVRMRPRFLVHLYLPSAFLNIVVGSRR